MIEMSFLEMLMLVFLIIGLGFLFIIMSMHAEQTQQLMKMRKETLSKNHYKDYVGYR